MSEFTKEQIAKMMDHAVLKPAMTDDDIRKNAKMCVERGVGDLCVRPSDTKLAAELVKGTGTTVAVVVGFPHGTSRPEVKALEARLAIEDGADEIDYVLNVGKLRSGDLDYIEDEMRAIVEVCREHGVTSKVILETCYLTDEEKKAACAVAVKVLPDFVKTSTGFGDGGATVADVLLMKEAVDGKVRIKASGGIRDLRTTLEMIEAGAERIGTSYSVDIMGELEKMMGK